MTTTKPTKSKLLGQHQFTFNGHSNGGEALIISTYLRDEGEFTSTKQELTLQSYCNSAHLYLTTCISTDTLRQVANDLEKSYILANAKALREKPKAETVLEIHTATLTPDDYLTLETTYVENGDAASAISPSVYTNQRLILGHAVFNLVGASIGAENLRKLANELDHFITSTLAT